MTAKKFISEKDLEELHKQREAAGIQETYDPDGRPLWEKLAEKKSAEEAAFLAKYANKGPRTLDEDESEYLDSLAEAQEAREKELRETTEAELKAFKQAKASATVVQAAEPTLPEKPEEKAPLAPNFSQQPHQTTEAVPGVTIVVVGSGNAKRKKRQRPAETGAASGDAKGGDTAKRKHPEDSPGSVEKEEEPGGLGLLAAYDSDT